MSCVTLMANRSDRRFQTLSPRMAARGRETDQPNEARGNPSRPGLHPTPDNQAGYMTATEFQIASAIQPLTRRHENEGPRRFKSGPLRQRVWLLRQSPGNSAKWPPLWPVLSAQPNQRGTNIGVIRRCASVSLRAGTGWFGFAIASAKRRGDPGCRCRGHRNEQAAYGWSNRSIRGRPLASGSSSPTAGRHAG